MNCHKFRIENGIMKSEEKLFLGENADLGKWFLESLKRKENFVGQIDPITGEESTYRKMFDESVRCAIWLKKNGLQPGDVVFTCTSNAMYSYIPVLATFYNGATHIFGHKSMHVEMVRYLFKLLKPKFIFTEEGEVEMLLKAVKEEKVSMKMVVFTKFSELDSLNDILIQSELKDVDTFCSLPPSNPDQNCLLSLTSGTTGDPKLVLHSYKQIMEALLICIGNGKDREMVSMVYLPLQWLMSLRVMLTDILIFAKRIIVKETSYDIQEAFQWIEKYKVTDVRFSLGMIYRMYANKELPKSDVSSLKTITINGVKLEPRIMKFLIQVAKNGKLMQTYGATEMSIPMFGGTMNKIDLNSCGYLFPNMEMKVIDVQTGSTLSPKEKGEICFKSSCLMKSYFQNQKATEEVIDSEGWYHTGDLGYYDETGLGYVLGRVKNTLMMQINGSIIPLWQADRALLLNSDVTEVSIIVLDSLISNHPQMIFAFVGLMKGSQVTAEELSELVNNLGDISIPICVKILEKLPRTTNGKIDFKELKKIAETST